MNYTLSNSFPVHYPVGIHMDQAFIFTTEVTTHLLENELLPENHTTQICIWCTGSSGSILASLLLQKLHNEGFTNLTLCYARQEKTSSHGDNYTFQAHDNATHLMIDDFVATGDTIKTIYKVFESYIASAFGVQNVAFKLGILSREQPASQFIPCLHSLSSGKRH